MPMLVYVLLVEILLGGDWGYVHVDSRQNEAKWREETENKMVSEGQT